MSPKIQTEIGIILNYLVLLMGVIFWNWQSFNLLLSFIIEYVSLMVVYLYVSVVIGNSIFDKVFATISHLVSLLALGLIQGFFVMFMAYMLDGELSFDKSTAQLPWLIPSLAFPMLIFQFMALRGKIIDIDLSDQKMGELVTSAVVFPIIISAGMLTYEWSDENEHASLIAVVVSRIALEIWYNHFRKKTPGRKKAKKINPF